MDTTSDALTHPEDSAPHRRKLTSAQCQKYRREIAIQRGMYGGTDIPLGDLQAWAARRARIPEIVEADRQIAAFRRWESRLWRRA